MWKYFIFQFRILGVTSVVTFLLFLSDAIKKAMLYNSGNVELKQFILKIRDRFQKQNEAKHLE